MFIEFDERTVFISHIANIFITESGNLYALILRFSGQENELEEDFDTLEEAEARKKEVLHEICCAFNQKETITKMQISIDALRKSIEEFMQMHDLD